MRVARRCVVFVADALGMYENESASKLEALFARALRVQLSDTEQEAARVTLETEGAKCRFGQSFAHHIGKRVMLLQG